MVTQLFPLLRICVEMEKLSVEDSLQNVYTFIFGLVICIIDMKEAWLSPPKPLYPAPFTTGTLFPPGMGKQSLRTAVQETWLQ